LIELEDFLPFALLALLGLGGTGCGQVDPCSLSQHFNGFGKSQSLLFHQKAEDIATFAASKAIKHLFVGAYRERGGLLGMKWAKTSVVFAGLFQQHRFAHHVDDIAGIPDFCDFIFWYKRDQPAIPPGGETRG
jgi:hypothetical protein